jgi:S-adenosylmethionine synthetase
MYEFTSESVSEGHPDKIADAISDAVAHLIIAGNQSHRAAVETLVTTDTVIVAGEYKSSKKISAKAVEQVIRDTIKEIGYEQDGFHWETVKITNKLHAQSADIALGTDTFGAGDQGLMFGYACTETPEYMPLAISLSHKILRKLEWCRKNPAESSIDWLGPDAKAQVTVVYEAPNMPIRVNKVVCSTQHTDDVSIQCVRDCIEQIIIDELAPFVDENTEYLINPTGRFVIGGPDGDTGVTGRKIIVDTYGGYCAHGGGAFSGKDCTKVDRSAAYMCRYIAKNIVASQAASNCTVQLSYAIGVEQPTSLYIYADGHVRDDIARQISAKLDLTPKGIIDKFDLFNLDLRLTTNYGHFGKEYLPWEQLDL